MEDFQQDQETIIQQLRLLLAAKEEELGKLRGRGKDEDADSATESVTDQLLSELKDKKAELEEMRERFKAGEAKARERISRLTDELAEKESMLASAGPEPASSRAAAADGQDGTAARLDEAFAAEREEANKKISALEESLREKENLLAEAAKGMPAAAAPSPPTEIVELRAELESARARSEETAKAYEDRVAALMQEMESLRSEASPGGQPESGLLREMERRIEEKDLSYRTAQFQLHKLRRSQQVLQGACAALGVFLIFILAMKTRMPAGPVLQPVTTSASPPAAAPLQQTDGDEISPHKIGGDDTIDVDEPPVNRLAHLDPAPANMDPERERAERNIAYTVQKGDNLWLICRRVLGDTRRMESIAKDNNIADPKSLKVGDVIYLSRK